MWPGIRPPAPAIARTGGSRIALTPSLPRYIWTSHQPAKRHRGHRVAMRDAHRPSMSGGVFGSKSSGNGVTAGGRFSAGAGVARPVSTQRSLPMVPLRCRQSGVSLVPADQASPLVCAVLAHIAATLVCRNSKAMRLEAAEVRSRSLSAVQGRHAQRAGDRVARTMKVSGPSRSLEVRCRRRTHALLAAAA